MMQEEENDDNDGAGNGKETYDEDQNDDCRKAKEHNLPSSDIENLNVFRSEFPLLWITVCWMLGFSCLFPGEPMKITTLQKS